MNGFPWLAVAVATLCVVALMLFALAPAWATRTPKTFPDERFNAADRYRQTLFAALGGLAVLLTFVWTFTKDRETLRLSAEHEGNSQYIEAAKMLSGPAVSTKAAAIFALGNLATTQPSLYLPIRETIVSFIASEQGVNGALVDDDLDVPLVDGAVRAALFVLGNRDTSNDDARWPFTLDGAHMDGASLHHMRSFRGTSFQGAYLNGADFRCANLDGAMFDGVSASDYNAYRGWTEDSADVESWEDWRKYRFIVNFEGASLRGVRFRGAGLAGARFVNADVSGADFSRANLSRADFAGARNISEAHFSDSQGSACADAEARFDGDIVKLPTCTKGSLVRRYRFAPVVNKVTFSSDPANCHGQTGR
jgi:uncharacterized protein YjbI with pentapeptide repeats